MPNYKSFLSKIRCHRSPVGPDLAKFHDFGKIVKVVGNILRVWIIVGNILNLPWKIYHAIWQIFISLNRQILKNNVAICSHCFTDLCVFHNLHTLCCISWSTIDLQKMWRRKRKMSWHYQKPGIAILYTRSTQNFKELRISRMPSLCDENTFPTAI